MRKLLIGGSLVVVAIALVVSVAFLPASAASKKCPISGKDVNPECTLNVNGKEVAFCCPGCPKAYLKKYKIADEGPKVCPLSGKPAKADQSIVHLTSKTLAFCCNNCRKKCADGNKIKFVDKGPGKCPLSGKPAKAEHKLVVNGESIYFCCNGCPKGYAKGLNLAAGGGKTCPISKKAAKEETAMIVVSGKKVYFCCGNCPKAYIKKNFAGKKKAKTSEL